MLRRLLLAAVTAFSAFAAVGAPTLPGAAFLLLISLAAIAVLLRRTTRVRSLPTPCGVEGQAAGARGRVPRRAGRGANRPADPGAVSV